MKHLWIILLLMPALTWAQYNKHYKIYSVSAKMEVDLDDMLEELRKADVVFFGEEHNDSVAHVLQLAVFEGLHQFHGKGLALSMEMFQTDVQLVLNEYLEGSISERNFTTDARPWNNYKDYKSIVEYAKEDSLYVLAANAPSRYTNRVTRHGLSSLNDLSRDAKKLLAPLPVDTLTGRYYEKFNDLLGGHQGMGDMKIYQSQNLWDATMAWQISRLAKKRSVRLILHLNGRFHSDEKLGTYAHLQRYAKRMKLMNVTSFSDESFALPDWTKWEHLADFIIVTDPEIRRSF